MSMRYIKKAETIRAVAWFTWEIKEVTKVSSLNILVGGLSNYWNEEIQEEH